MSSPVCGDVPSRLRSAYGAFSHTNSALFRDLPLRELLTVTAHIEFVLAPSSSLSSSLSLSSSPSSLSACRARHLQWYQIVQRATRQTNAGELRALWCDWVCGFISYELRAMDEAMARAAENTTVCVSSSSYLSPSSSCCSCSCCVSSSYVLCAMSHAAELRVALQCRLPRLLSFLFPQFCDVCGAAPRETFDFPFPLFVRDAVCEKLREPQSAALLQRVLCAALRFTRLSLRNEIAGKEKLSSSSLSSSLSSSSSSSSNSSSYSYSNSISSCVSLLGDVFALVRATVAAERLIRLVLRSAVDACDLFFPRLSFLRALLKAETPNAAREFFLAREFPAFFRAELFVCALRTVRPEWLRAVIAARLFLWDPEECGDNNTNTRDTKDNTKDTEDTEDSTKDNTKDTKDSDGTKDTKDSDGTKDAGSLCVDLSRCYLSRLLRATLSAPFSSLFALSAPADSLSFSRAFHSIAALSRGVKTIAIPPRLALRKWTNISAGPPLPNEMPRDFGSAAMAKVCGALIDEEIQRAISHILRDKRQPQNITTTTNITTTRITRRRRGIKIIVRGRMMRLLRYLLRAERAFIFAFRDVPLRARLFDQKNGAARFFGAVSAAFVGETARRGARAFVGEVLRTVHIFLQRQHAEEAEASSSNSSSSSSLSSNSSYSSYSDSSNSSLDDAKFFLRSETDARAALRLARCAANTTEMAKLYKERLAQRLLSPAPKRALSLERRMCTFLRETLPSEMDETRQMRQMCDDAMAPPICFAEKKIKTKREPNVRLTVRELSRLAWPPFPALLSPSLSSSSLSISFSSSICSFYRCALPAPVLRAICSFAASRNGARRVLWLRTTKETANCAVIFPRGAKSLTAPLALAAALREIGKSGAAGAPRTRKEKEKQKEQKEEEREEEKREENHYSYYHNNKDNDRDENDEEEREEKHHSYYHNNKDKDRDENEEEREEREEEEEALEHELRQLEKIGIIVAAGDGARVRLNAEFASPQEKFCVVRRTKRREKIREKRRAADNGQPARLAGIQAVIMKKIKAEGKCRYGEMLESTRETIQQFHLHSVMFKVALERLVEKEYIERDSVDKQMFIYRA